MERVVENPLSGERITIQHRHGGPRDETLRWELVLAPGGRVPSSHAHPHQHERFTVLEGALEFRLGWRRLHLGPGDAVTVPPGRVHHFANRGPAPTRVAVATSPALAIEDLLATAASLAQDQRRGGKRFPRLVDLALFIEEFEAEVSPPWAPSAVTRTARSVARLARLLHRDRRYQQLRMPAGTPGVHGQ